jgi:hypothetical protein
MVVAGDGFCLLARTGGWGAGAPRGAASHRHRTQEVHAQAGTEARAKGQAGTEARAKGQAGTEARAKGQACSEGCPEACTCSSASKTARVDPRCPEACAFLLLRFQFTTHSPCCA